jgi:hypothetical protein
MIIQNVLAHPGALPDSGKDHGTHRLEYQNWGSVEGIRASFDIRHDGSSILLKYFVLEKQVRAVNTEYNSAVWEDSCVEFFLMPAGEIHYYNFEFNAIGTLLAACGSNRHHRTPLPAKLLKAVETYPSLGRKPIVDLPGPVAWTLEARIPAGLLVRSQPENLPGLKARGNFYKCGDRLKEPHYLSWKPVLTGRPDFHSPQFFGDLEFE